VKRSAAAEVELDRILEMVAAHAASAAARRQIRSSDTLPALGEGVLASRLTDEINRLLDEDGRLTLAGLDEAEPWLDATASPPRAAEDLMSLLTFARRLLSVRRSLQAAPGELELLHDLGGRLPDTEGLVGWAASRLGRDGQVPDSASPELAALRHRLASGRRELLERLQAIQRSHPGAVTDAPPTLRRDRYCLPVHRGARSQLPGLVLSSSGSGATLYLEPYEIVELNNDLVDIAAREQAEVQRILDEVSAAFTAAREELAGGLSTLIRLDAGQARALFGRAAEGRVVVPGEGEQLVLRGARHPLLDGRLQPLRAELFGEPERERSRPVVPLDLALPEGVRTLVISGPNAGGKTVVLKTLGLLVLMAYNGIPLPADEGTAIPELDSLWVYIGDEQELSADLSTFSGAMSATAAMLRAADARSLVLYDELGAGTDPLEGAALGCGVLEQLTACGALTVATTHLAAIAVCASSTEGVENAAMEFDEEAGRPTYTLRIGRPGRSHGLEIAAAMGLPEATLARARELLGGKHLELEQWLKRLESLEADLLAERRLLEQRAGELDEMKASATDAVHRLAQEREELRASLDVERSRLRQRARRQLDEALARIEAAEKEGRHLGRRRREQLRSAALHLDDETPAPRGTPGELEPGDVVRILSLASTGIVEQLKGSTALVSCGGKRVWVPCSDLEPAPQTAAHSPRSEVRVRVDETVPNELHLIGMDAEAAREELERYLDRALAAGKPLVRIVHGHGTGTLRKMVQELVRRHPAVRSFHHPPQSRGGTGATEIDLLGAADG
jgi:DNA mismatch repair protein MutS2